METDPFLSPNSEVNEAGNSRPSNLPPPTKKTGFWQSPRGQNDFYQNLGELLEHGDSDQGKGKAKRAKPVDHNARTKKHLESFGYMANRLEKWVTYPSGASFKQDYLGLFDFEGLKEGSPRILVQVCGKTGKGPHLRQMCSDKIAPDNRRPRIVNLRFCLAQGWKCYLLIWTKNDSNGRYDWELFRITTQVVDEVVARKQGPPRKVVRR